MLDKLKNLLLLISYLAAIGTGSVVSAQNDNKVLVLASGKTLRQSDIAAVVKFYECAFETKFTAAQRDEFQRLKEAKTI